MRRARLDQFTGRLVAASPARSIPSRLSCPPTSRLSQQLCVCRRNLSTKSQLSSAAASPELIYEDDHVTIVDDDSNDHALRKPARRPLPSPHPSRARQSAKLAALHARLSLPQKLPLETLARALVDASADANPRFNNANLAYIGTAVLNNHASEFLIAKYPRLPISILFTAMKGFVGHPVLHQVARAWGVEAAAAPGEEVDPGLLQFDKEQPTVMMSKWGYVRAESGDIIQNKWRRGWSSRVVYDDAFGDMVENRDEGPPQPEVSGERNTKDVQVRDVARNAHANFVRAVIGAIYAHCGRDAAKKFVRAHFLSRTLDLSNLFEFTVPTRILARLCAREDFDPPVARLESETGRASRTPVFVVGIYSGHDKLGEGVGPSLNAARVAAAMNALKSWYLYSPGEVAVPSDTLGEGAEDWKPLHIDIGEVVA